MQFGATYWKRVVSAHVVLGVIDWVFDNVLYGLVIVAWGTLVGGLVMTFASLVICSIYLIAYEKMGIDWLGVGAVEAVKEHGEGWVKRLESRHILIRVVSWIPSRIFLLVLWAIKKNDFCAFIALSIYEDAFKTTAFLRKGRFNGLKVRDWRIFIASILLSNLYWIVRWTAIIEIGKMLLARIGVLE